MIDSQEASTQPPLGPKLGQYGINIVEFCNQFNTYSANILEGIPLYVKVKIFVVNKNFIFNFDSIPLTYLLFKEFRTFDYKKIVYYLIVNWSKLTQKDKKRLYKILLFIEPSHLNTVLRGKLRELKGSLKTY